MKKIIIFILLFKSLIYAASYENARHAVGIDFGTTFYSTVSLPFVGNLLFKSQNGLNDELFKGGFGIGFTYNYAYLPKQAIDAYLGIYNFSSYYNGTITINGSTDYQKSYKADVIVIPASIGVRFYFNKSNRDNGFFLLPKIGMNILAVNGKDYSADKEELSAIVNFYISGEMGFKIDMFTKKGANWPVRPFIDISLIDLGYSFTHGLRFIWLPRIAVGVTF